MADRSQYLAEIDRLVASQALHGSESLCKLLRYLAKHALEQPGIPLKEYQIATELFGRQPDFDPQLDSMVRVQAGRLRSKLAEYYGAEGAEHHAWVELPKGTYVLSFHQGVPQKAHGGNSHDVAREAAAKESPSRKNLGIAVGILSVALALALVGIAILLAMRKSNRDTGVGAVTGEAVPAVFPIFWKGFLTGPEEPWVIFSNAAFVGRPDLGLRYYNPAHDSREQIFDHYTGVGEVLAVHSLDTVFGLLRQPIRVKRGSLFSLDDAKNNDLIFIGSPSENLTLLEIPGTQEFVFRSVPSGPRKGNMEIINVHPQAGEPREAMASPANVPLTEDYSVIALVHGLNPERSVLILAGTTTIGTQAAVEYVCQQESLQDLLRRLGVTQPGELKPFEALIRVKVARGVPVGTEMVAIRKLSS
ncbi:MAG TPA: hypothetical protein VGI16_14130 [Candidatus Acidoferrum sp.]